MSLTWGQIKQLVDKEVADSEPVHCIEYLDEPYIDITYNARKKEVEIYGSFRSPEDREGS